MSCFGARANVRAADAQAVFEERLRTAKAEGEFETQCPLTGNVIRGSAGGMDSVQAATTRFEIIMSGIDALRGSSNIPAVTLKPSEPIQEHLPQKAMRYYRVPLPSRPSQVNVCLSRVSGMPPQLYGSTEHERPTMKACEQRSRIEDGILTYQHALDLDDFDGIVDRLKAVPKANNLYVCAMNSGECSYTISVSMRPARIVLSRAECALRTQFLRRGYEARIEELNRDPTQRAAFEERLCDLQHEHGLKDTRLRKNDIVNGVTFRSLGKNFIHLNKTTAPKHSPAYRYRKILASAMRRCERQKKRELTAEPAESGGGGDTDGGSTGGRKQVS